MPKRADQPYTQETSVVLPDRDRGRPKGAGRIMFTMEQINSLPDEARICDLQRVLGMSLASVQQWTERRINPLKFTNKDRRRWFDKKAVIAWMKATRHVEEEKENGKTNRPVTRRPAAGKATGTAAAGKDRPVKGDVSKRKIR